MTKENPTCFHGALNYLSSLTGISKKKEIILKDISHTRHPGRNGKTGKLAYPCYNIFVIIEGKKYWCPQKKQIKGGESVWVLRNEPFGSEQSEFPISTQFDSVGVVVNRTISEFGIEPERIGGYKDSLGGGWYQNCTMYKVGNCYYVPDMECACRHNGTD